MRESGKETVLTDREAGVATITLNRPRRRNAINRRMLDALARALDAAEADPEVRVVVLTGAGGSFSSGFDLQEQAELRPAGEAHWREILEHAFSTLMRCWRLSKPTVAAVRGPCLAGGCELALACAITIAGDDAIFGEPELRFGAGIVVMILPWLVGPKRAKDIILTGRSAIGAREALNIGLVSRVVPAAEVLAAAKAVAGQMAIVEPVLLNATKRSLNRALEVMGMERALEESLRADVALEAAGTPEKAEFLEIVRAAGLRAALDWRDRRWEPSKP
jgi:enoyl-CoA hydratase